jgi:hypothetical protein
MNAFEETLIAIKNRFLYKMNIAENEKDELEFDFIIKDMI